MNPDLSSHHDNMAISKIWHADDINRLINDHRGIIHIYFSPFPTPLHEICLPTHSLRVSELQAGQLAQLVEHWHPMQEVLGSNPGAAMSLLLTN